MREDTSFSDRKLTREEFSHKYWKDGEHPYQYHTAEIEDGRDEREQFLINQCRALHSLYRHTYKVFPTRTDLWEEKQTSRTRYRFILALICPIYLILLLLFALGGFQRKQSHQE